MATLVTPEHESPRGVAKVLSQYGFLYQVNYLLDQSNIFRTLPFWTWAAAPGSDTGFEGSHCCVQSGEQEFWREYG